MRPLRDHTPITVSTPGGAVTGVSDDSVHLFRGIRYAEPPVGDLRFAPPVDAAPVDTIDATAFGPVSLQDIDPLPRAVPGCEHNFYALDVVTSEDCLNLNVWTSDLEGSAPVLVWIHGGAFLYGSGAGAWTDGTRFARDRGLVVVTLNYRLGLLGNLWLGDTDPRCSDLALQDQISALRWVQRNIASFGGDPARVTIAGQSAGAMSVAALMTAPAAAGLFAGAIVESGHLSATRDVAAARESRDRVFTELGVDQTGDVFAQLRALSTPRILQVQREFGIGLGAFPLVADDVVLPTDSLGCLRDGKGAQVPLIIGTTSAEDRLFSITGWADETTTSAAHLRRLVRDDDALVAEAVALYAEVPGSDRDRTFVINTEVGWTLPARDMALAHASAGNAVYHYEYARRSPAVDGRVGAAHLSELPVFWNNLDAPGVESLLGDGVARDPGVVRLADEVSASIARFVATGSPAGGGVEWPAFAPDVAVTRVIDLESELVVDRLAARLDFLRAHAHGSIFDTVGVEA